MVGRVFFSWSSEGLEGMSWPGIGLDWKKRSYRLMPNQTGDLKRMAEDVVC
jgi:hypothetical protein